MPRYSKADMSQYLQVAVPLTQVAAVVSVLTDPDLTDPFYLLPSVPGQETLAIENLIVGANFDQVETLPV